jgi:hypothetical protein
MRFSRKSVHNVSTLWTDSNKTGIKYANRYVKKTGNTDALMYFYIDDSTEFSKKSGTELIEERVFFTDARKILAKKLGLYTRIAMKVVDDKKRAVLLHLRINNLALKLPREPVSGLLGIKPLSTNKRAGHWDILS